MIVSVSENKRGSIISKTAVFVYMEQQMWRQNTRYLTWHSLEQVKMMGGVKGKPNSQDIIFQNCEFLEL